MGLIVPKTLLTWVRATILVLGLINFDKDFRSNKKSGVTGIYFNLAFLDLANCYGTKLEMVFHLSNNNFIAGFDILLAPSLSN